MYDSWVIDAGAPMELSRHHRIAVSALLSEFHICIVVSRSRLAPSTRGLQCRDLDDK